MWPLNSAQNKDGKLYWPKGTVLQVTRFLIVSAVMTSVSIKYQNSRAKYAGDEKTRINQPQGHEALPGTNLYDNM